MSGGKSRRFRITDWHLQSDDLFRNVIESGQIQRRPEFQ